MNILTLFLLLAQPAKAEMTPEGPRYNAAVPSVSFDFPAHTDLAPEPVEQALARCVRVLSDEKNKITRLGYVVINERPCAIKYKREVNGMFYFLKN